MVIDMIAAALSLRHPRVRSRQNMSVAAADKKATRLLDRLVGRSLRIQVAVTSLRIQVHITRPLIAMTAVTALHTRILVEAVNRRVSANVRLSPPELARRRLFAFDRLKFCVDALEAAPALRAL